MSDVKQIQELTDEQLRLAAIESARRVSLHKRCATRATLTSLAACEELATRIMVERWDDDDVGALTDALIALAGTTADDALRDDVGELESTMGDVSNARDDLNSMDEDDDDYVETSDAVEEGVADVLERIGAHWAKYGVIAGKASR